MTSIDHTENRREIIGSAGAVHRDGGDGLATPADHATTGRPAGTVKFGSSVADMIIARYGAGRSLHDLARSASATGQSARRQEISLQIRKAAELLFPLAQMIRAYGLGLPVIAAANMSITAKVGGGRRLWAYAATGNDMMLGGKVITPRAIWFQVTPDRVGGYARKELAGFQGVLMAPPGTGYETICRAGPCDCSGCWHHIATQARELEPITPHPVIEALLRTMETLRLVERDAAKASNAERVRLRQTRSAPAVMDLRTAFVAAQEMVPARSALGRFLADTLDKWPALTLFLENGALPPENGAVEQILERLSWRDRWIFSWHPNAHLWSATIFTILESCAANGIDGRFFLSTVLDMLHGSTYQEIGPEMLPWQFGVNNKSAIIR